jgi:hypothetical protein
MVVGERQRELLEESAFDSSCALLDVQLLTLTRKKESHRRKGVCSGTQALESEVSDLTVLERERSKLINGWWRAETHRKHCIAR